MEDKRQGHGENDIKYKDLILVSVDKNIPFLQVNAFTMDDNDGVIKNIFGQKYQAEGIWVKNKDGKISLSLWDMFVDKNKWS